MHRRTTIAILCLLLLSALLALWFRYRPTPVKIDRTPIIGVNTGVGARLAEMALQAVPGQGRIVLVTDYDHTRGDHGRDYRWETFHAELKKQSGVTIAATEIVEFDPSEPEVSACPSAAFKAILERHADAGAIVFFIDLPDWSKVAGLIPQPVGPKIIAVDNMGEPHKPRYGGYFTSGFLAVLIGARSAPAAALAQPKTPREWFDQHYQVYTPQNFETLPE